MTSRPDKILGPVPGTVTPTFVAARPGSSRRRYSAATLHGTVASFASPAVRRVPDGNGHRQARGIAAWMGYPGRLIIFNLAVAVIHFGMLRWIFLPIGG